MAALLIGYVGPLRALFAPCPRGAARHLNGDSIPTGGLIDFFVKRQLERLARDVETLRAKVEQRLEQLAAAEAGNTERRHALQKQLEGAIHAG